MTAAGLQHDAELEEFVARAEERGCAQESEIETLVARLDLSDSQVLELREALADSGVEVRDDCGKEAPATT